MASPAISGLPPVCRIAAGPALDLRLVRRRSTTNGESTRPACSRTLPAPACQPAHRAAFRRGFHDCHQQHRRAQPAPRRIAACWRSPSSSHCWRRERRWRDTAKEKELEARVAQLEQMVQELVAQQQQTQSAVADTQAQVTEVKTAQAQAPAAVPPASHRSRTPRSCRGHPEHDVPLRRLHQARLHGRPTPATASSPTAPPAARSTCRARSRSAATVPTAAIPTPTSTRNSRASVSAPTA